MTTLHIVPHTHWDREWYLPFQEMRIKLVHLVDALLRILESDPDYLHFTLDGQTSVVDDYLEIRPERRPEIARHVREGRLLVGPWAFLPDEFLVSPEALVRNLRLGATRARAIGGERARMDVGYVPDPFGHIGQLPQILQGFGIESAALRRGLGDEATELCWEAPDGSRVLLAYLRDGYDNAARLPTNPRSFASVVRSCDASLAEHSAVSHRLLMNGTDHHEPQPELPSLLASADTGGDRWLLSTLPAYLEAVRKEIEGRSLELPIVRGELRNPRRHHLLPGVLSSRTWIKQRNDTCERLLERWAEPFLAWADHFCGGEPDRRVWTGHLETPRIQGAAALLERAWGLLLECQPHDSICGCSVDAVHDEMRSRFDQCEQIGEEVTRQSLVALAAAVDTTALETHGARQALVLFNPAPVPRSEIARACLELGAGLDGFEVIDAEGRVLPHRVVELDARELARLDLEPRQIQSLARGIEDGRILGLAIESISVERRARELRIDLALSEGGEPRMAVVKAGLAALEEVLGEPGLERVRVDARFATRATIELCTPELPAHGYRSVGLRPAPAPSSAPRRDADRSIANEYLRVEAQQDGTITLTDLRSGATFEGLLRVRDRGERGDSYTTCPLDGEEPISEPVRVRIGREVVPGGEALDIDEMFRVPRSLTPDRSRRTEETVELPVRIRIALVGSVPRADVDVHLENRALDHRLELLFPLGAPAVEASYDGHFEIVRRPTEIPRGGADWQEQPRPEQPMRCFVAARPDGDPEDAGLLLAAHGLREASVSPDGVIAITLLRCFGWLSRDDLTTRAGGAGPPTPTPGGQSPGPHDFRLSLIPSRGNGFEAAAHAEAFQTQPRGVSTGLHTGRLPGTGSLLEVEPLEFRLTAVQPASERGAIVVRGVFLGRSTGEVRLRPRALPARVERVRLDETPLAEIEPGTDGWIRLVARPDEIISLRLSYDGVAAVRAR